MMALRRRHRHTAAREETNLANVEEGSDDGVKATWIELNFKKRECVKFVPSATYEGLQRCGCGRLASSHDHIDADLCGTYSDKLHPTTVDVKNEFTSTKTEICPTRISSSSQNLPNNVAEHSSRRQRNKKSRKSDSISNDAKWNVTHHTYPFPTDAFGTLEYQGTGEGDKSQFIRLAHDTHPELVLRLLTDEWGLQRPKMVITVHGGVHNFQLQPRLQRILCEGLIKAAKTTGAWIMLFGLNTGVGSIVGNALKEHKARSRGKIYSIGVAPWGVVDNREDLIGSQTISSYQTMSNPLSKGAVLNAAHTHFLLVDNGTEGKYGSELKFRRRLERKLSMQQINQKHGGRIPLVCLVLEGGKNTINVVLESVRQSPPIPVIVIDGSGRAADLLAFAHQYADDDGTMMEELRLQFVITIQNTFACEREQAQFIFLTIMECVKRKDLITVFRWGQGQSKHDDLDNTILTASLKGKRTSAPDMLSLALSWNRIDIAKRQIFVYGQQWPVLSLEQAMMDALIQDRTDFVKLLMENGVSMHKFLIIPRLEELYNIKQMPLHLLYLLQDIRKNITYGTRFNLIEIGQLIESLMGGAYRCNYTRKRFRVYYASQSKGTIRKPSSFSKHLLPSSLSRPDITSYCNDMNSTVSLKKSEKDSDVRNATQCQVAKDFQYPFHELMVWAVLMKRQKMALFMWQHGEEAIAKALAAAKLYKAMAHEAADDDLDLDEMEELRKYSSEFCDLATKLLEISYRADNDATQHLLTYELKQWSKHTCLSLAIAAQHRDFIAHPCCQLLLNDLWMGGLNVRKNSSLRVILGIAFFPSIFMLQFKSLDELRLMPQTAEEHMDGKSDSSSVSSTSSSSLSSSTSSSSSSSSASNSTTSGFQRKPEVVCRGVTGLDHSDQLPEDGYIQFMSQQKQLSVGKKFYEFYNAPITKFWLHTFSFIAFLLMFTYVVLVEMKVLPSPVEWVIVSCIFTMFLEKIREIGASEPSGVFKKLKLWLGQFWHLVDISLIVIFFIGFALRMAQDAYLLSIARSFYCVNVSLWYIRLLNIFSVSKYLGPYVTMIGKMMVDLGTFIILLAVVLVSFGVTRQALLHPHESPSWSLLKNIFLEPYFMLYGEVYAPTIDPCNDENAASLCVVGSWIVPTAMTLYLLVANILLLNMLIAVFNNTFTKMKNISDKIWRFHRYSMIVEYEFRPMLPPPFIVLNYLIMIFRQFFKKRKNAIFNSDRGLKLFLDDEDVEKLHDFEEDCVDDLFRRKVTRDDKDDDPGSNFQGVSACWAEKFNEYVDESGEMNTIITSQLQSIEERLAMLEEANRRVMCALPNISGPQFRPSDFSHSEHNSDEASFLAMKDRMRFRLRRIRQDSEMSTFSDWNPSNLLLQRLKSVNVQQRERHASEQHPKELYTEHRLRKTNSTGNMKASKLHLTEAPMSTTTLASSRNDGSSHALARLFNEPEEKAVSCQDLRLTKGKKHSDDESAHTKHLDSAISGSEFFPSDFVDTPGETRQCRVGSFSPPQKTTSRSGEFAKIHPENDMGLMLKFRHHGHSRKPRSNSESSSSSMTESDHMSTSGVGRHKKFAKDHGKPNKKLSARGLPTLIINSPEKVNNLKNEAKNLSPIEDSDPVTSKDYPKLKRGLNSLPLLNLDDPELKRTGNSIDPSLQVQTPVRAMTSYRTSSFSRNQHPGNLMSPLGFQANQPHYKSITDCIDTSKWHDINSMPLGPPPTPFETWWNKPPNFMTNHPIKQQIVPERMSQDEWEDQLSSRQETSRSRKSRRHRSSSSIKSLSSHRARSGVRRHRHKKKKKLKRVSSSGNEDETNPCLSPGQLGILKENSNISLKGTHDDTVFVTSPPSSGSFSPPTFNINNSNLSQASSNSFKTENNDVDSFFSRYSAISEENVSATPMHVVETRKDSNPEQVDEDAESHPLLE